MAFAGNRTLVQSVYFDSSSLATVVNDATLPYGGQLGMIVVKGGLVYQLVQVSSTSATVAVGSALTWIDFGNFIVTSDYDATGTSRNFPAGIALGTVTAGNYTFIQIGGVNLTVVSTGSLSVGDVAIMNSSDGTVVGIAAGTAPTYIPFGPVTVAAAANVVGVNLMCPLNL